MLLERECGEDHELLAEVSALLEADASGHSLLDEPVADIAGRVVHPPGAAYLGRQFGPYRLTEVVGEGGMGVVYVAEREDLGNRVAIKILRDATLSPARRERFVAEQRTLAQLNHPAIAQLHDAEALPDGTPWFAMEFVQGVPLTEYCAAHESSVESRLLLLRAVAEAVQHAHRHLIIHRDLKPSNILVRDDGSVKLLDFGIAKQLESETTDAALTRTGLRLMTPAYAAPEQLTGGRSGIHTDVYSLGVILYELLTGRQPFELAGRGPAEIERIITSAEPERPSAVARRAGTRVVGGRGAWADLDVLCLTAMHADPARRYPTVDAFIRDIDHHLAGEPLEARPDTVGYRSGKFLRRHREAVATIAAVATLLIGLVAFYTVRLARARDAALAEASRTQRVQGFLFSLFEGDDELVGPADSLRVLTLLDRGIREARSLGDEPTVQAELYFTLGGIYQQLGRLDRADSLLTVSLDTRRGLFGAEDPDVAEVEVALADLRADQADYATADTLVRQGLARLRRALPPDHPRIPRALVTRGRVFEELGEYDSAVVALNEAIEWHQRNEPRPSPGLAEALTGLGNTYFYSGALPAADSVFRQVLEIDTNLHGELHPTVAEDLINVGAVAHEQGRYAEAEGYYRRAVAITRGFFGERHPRTASNLTMLGRNLVYQDRLDEAAVVLNEAIDVQEAVYGPDHPSVASAVNELGTMALLNGRLDEAETAYRRMARIYAAAFPDGHWLSGIATSNLASVEMRRERFAEAARLYAEAVASFVATQGSESVNTGIGRIKLGRALLRQGRFAEASGETQAGYDILTPQMEPGVSWLQSAREDLAAAYAPQGREDLATRYREEYARNAPPPEAE